MSEHDPCVDPTKHVQVDSTKHYFSRDYCSPLRLASYAYQIGQTLDANPREVLEIGPGNGMVSYVLRRAGINVVTLDFCASLQPDVVGCVTQLPVATASFDLVLCCEVLEHMPYDQFPVALQEMRRVARHRVVLTLPDIGRCCQIQLILPGLGRRWLMLPLPRLRAPLHVFDGQHYWEIGKRGYSVKRVLRDMQEAGFDMLRNYRILEHPYHHMFVLGKSQVAGGLESPGD